MSRYTLVFEWPDGQEPLINRDTSFMGGSICAVQFGDALTESDILRERIAERDATCTWTEDPDGYWATDCGEAFEIHVGSPAENGLRYCCFCGRQLREAGSCIPADS